MTHWLLETMVFTRRHQQHAAGTRISRNHGRTWIVAGRIEMGKGDVVETRIRELSAREYGLRSKQVHALEVVVPA